MLRGAERPARSADRWAAVLTGARREPLAGHAGKSGSMLERAWTADGRPFVVKRIRPRRDVLARLLGDEGREASVFLSGLLDRLPDEAGHVVLHAEPDEEGWLLVLRDVSEHLLAADRILTRDECGRIFAAVTSIHRAFEGAWIDGLCPLRERYRVFSPAAAAAAAGEDTIADLILRGWEVFWDLVPAEVGEAVAAAHAEPDELAERLLSGPVTLIHGDLFPPNLALEPDRVLFLDWGMFTGMAPPHVDLAHFVSVAWSRVEPSREQLIADFCRRLGPLHDDRSLRLALFGALVELGWNKGLDIAEGSPAVRERERGDLDWWVGQTRRALEVWN